MRYVVRSMFLLALLVLSGSVRIARAQDGAQPKTPPTPVKAVLDNWNDVGGRLITMAQDWPEDKYSYKLTPQVRSFQQVILHIAGANYDMINRLTGTKAGDARNDPPVAEYKTKAETIAFLKKSVADGAALAEKEGDAGVIKNLEDWIGYTEHMGEHYGLLVAYYRASGGVPPASRPKK
ncbi:MAG: DinB family protein [Candidatus Acidiferrales bacterium]